jgi:hypothetical protein
MELELVELRGCSEYMGKTQLWQGKTRKRKVRVGKEGTRKIQQDSQVSENET